jgi:hypothetical protein
VTDTINGISENPIAPRLKTPTSLASLHMEYLSGDTFQSGAHQQHLTASV